MESWRYYIMVVLVFIVGSVALEPRRLPVRSTETAAGSEWPEPFHHTYISTMPLSVETAMVHTSTLHKEPRYCIYRNTYVQCLYPEARTGIRSHNGLSRDAESRIAQTIVIAFVCLLLVAGPAIKSTPVSTHVYKSI